MARWKDLDLNFTAHPTTGDVTILEDADAVKRSVRNLVLMSKYEKPFHPDINVGIRELLFEPLSPITAMAIRQNIISSITQYEPRANLIEVQVIADPDRNAFAVKIYFKIVNLPDPVMLDLTLKRLR